MPKEKRERTRAATFAPYTVRSSTREQTVSGARARGERSTRTSAAAGKVRRSTMLSGDFPSGSYGHGRQTGPGLMNKGHGSHIKVEIDHAPTDGSQRGGLARESAENQAVTFQRPAFVVPKSWHRQHPTTAGGSHFDPKFAQMQQHMQLGYPHVGTESEMHQRGREAATEQHLLAYAPIASSSSLGAKRRQTIVGAVEAMVTQPTQLHTGGGHEQVHLTADQQRSLVGTAKKVFSDL
ncbi:MAG: hypothetical protein HY308_02910 [Gammaproteobacteria bacterium]|nr:hypothetical protein [Gammaproteobacteria bacterium]